MIRFLLVSGLLFALFGCERPSRDKPAAKGKELVLHCGAGMRKPVADIAKKFEEEYGVTVRLQFGGSGQLLTQLGVAGGDLPAD